VIMGVDEAGAPRASPVAGFAPSDIRVMIPLSCRSTASWSRPRSGPQNRLVAVTSVAMTVRSRQFVDVGRSRSARARQNSRENTSDGVGGAAKLIASTMMPCCAYPSLLMSPTPISFNLRPETISLSKEYCRRRLLDLGR